MVHRLSGYAAAATTLNLTYGLGRVTHILIHQVCAFTATQLLSIRLTSKHHEPVQLVNRINLLLLQEISNYEQGFSQLLSGQINTAAYLHYSLAVALGNLDLQATDSQLEITLEIPAITGNAGSVALCCNRPDEPDFYIQHGMSAAMSGSLKDCDRIYLAATGVVIAPFTSWTDLNVSIDTPATMPAYCDIKDLIAWTAVFGEIEAYDPQWVYVAFHSEDELGHPVAYSLVGAQATVSPAAGVGIFPITRCKIYKKARLALSTVARIARAETAIAPRTTEKQIALAAAGISATMPQLAVMKKGAAALKKMKGGTGSATD
jgi:hypothetical protein